MHDEEFCKDEMFPGNSITGVYGHNNMNKICPREKAVSRTAAAPPALTTHPHLSLP